MQGLGGLGDVVGVDDKRVGAERRGGARLAGEHERAAALGQHGALLRDQVHAVTDRVHQQHVGERAGGQRPGVIVLYLEDQRIPVRRAELLADLPREPLHPVGVGAVLRHRGPGRVCEGQVDHAAPPLRAGDEQFAVGGETAHDVLGQFCPVNPDDQPAPVGRPAQRLDVRAHIVGSSAFPQRGRVHAERVDGHLGHAVPVTDPRERSGCPGRVRGIGQVHLRAEERRAAVEERQGPAPGEEADVVRAEHSVQHGPADLVGQHLVVGGRRPRGMREVRDPQVRRATAGPVAQHPGGEGEVVVLDQRADAARWHRPRSACSTRASANARL